MYELMQVSENKEMVAAYSNHGWTMYTTNAEAARQTGMCTIYNEAWRNAKNGVPIQRDVACNSESDEGTFDVKA